MSPAPQSALDRAAARRYANSWSAIMRLVRDGSSWSGRERNCSFLNCGQGAAQEGGVEFANISAVSQLDFLDDGRAVALCDWDGDGDLDIWLRNRTAPRLRLMLNRAQQLAPDSRQVSFQLRGTEMPDAIGARVELHVEGAGNARFVRSVTAGDAFLSQSSKKLSFGIPAGATVLGVSVSWPGGGKERFAVDRASGSFLLQQGSGRVEGRNAEREVSLSPSNAPPIKTSATARIILPATIPVPTLKLWDAQAAPFALEQKPTLLLFFSSSCPHCAEELADVAQHAQRLHEVGLNVVAIGLDALDELPSDESPGIPLAPAAAALAKQIRFPFTIVQTTAQSMDRLTEFRNALFDMNPTFVTPYALLLDARNEVNVIYRGAFGTEAYAADAKLFESSAAERRGIAYPVSGTWITSPATASQFADFVSKRMMAHDPIESTRYLEAAMSGADSSEQRDELRKRLVRTYRSLLSQATAEGDRVKQELLQAKLRGIE